MTHPRPATGATRRRLLVVAVAAGALLVHPGAVAAATDDATTDGAPLGGTPLTGAPLGGSPLATASSHQIDRSSRAGVRSAFRTRYRPAYDTPIGWTGSVSGCRAGAPSAAAQQATLTMVNYFRAMADLPPVTFDAGLSAKAQQAALMMTANDTLSHFPPTSWACYSSAGAEAAGASNLALGAPGARGVSLQVWDPGPHNTAVGHRRWILFPPALTMGSGSTSNANALWVFGSWGPHPHTRPVEWPSAGFFPRELEPGGRWSVSLPGADLDVARVVVRRNGGAPLPLTLHRPQYGYGDPTLVWELGNLDERNGLPERTYRVEVTGIRGAAPSTHTYEVTMIDGEPVPQRPPVGQVERASATGRRITLSGWAYDPNLPAGGLQVRVTSRLWSGTVRATRPRPELVPFGVPAASGFQLEVDLPPGTHVFCLQARDHNGTAYTAATTNLGCHEVVVK